MYAELIAVYTGDGKYTPTAAAERYLTLCKESVPKADAEDLRMVARKMEGIHVLG
jgi:hypothetical protein